MARVHRPDPASELTARLAAAARAAGEFVIQQQRALHEIPELAFEEHQTARHIVDALRALGLTPRAGVAGTGVVCELPGRAGGPTVMLRAEMDGLPITEDSLASPRSRRPGCMHACGHDGHMAIVLGAARAVLASRVELPGRIVLLFQPGEERGAGANKVREQGVLDDLGVDYVVGLHLWSPLRRGVALAPAGPVMASADEFRVVLSGTGGHGALPHEASDVVLAASHLVLALQGVVARNVDPLSPAVVSVGRIWAGEAANVLPESVEIAGTFRTADSPTRDLIRRRLGELADLIARAHGATAELHFEVGYPATINDPHVATVVQAAVRAVLGPRGLLTGPMTMAAEDFAHFLQARPGAMFLLGMRDEAQGVIHPHHSPRFRLAEDVLPQGLEIMLRAAGLLMTIPREERGG